MRFFCSAEELKLVASHFVQFIYILDIRSMEAALIEAFKSTACFKELSDICNTFENAVDVVDAKNVAVKDKLLKVLGSHEMCMDQELHCKEVGGTPFNRGNEGILATRCHRTVATIKANGFSNVAIAPNLIALQDNPYRRDFAKYIAQLHKTNPLYAPYKESEVKVGSLGATHAVHGFSCVYEEVKTTSESISINGRMSREKVYNNDPMFKAAVEGKLKFTVVRWEVHAALPLACRIISKALNTVQQVSEGSDHRNLMRPYFFIDMFVLYLLANRVSTPR